MNILSLSFYFTGWPLFLNFFQVFFISYGFTHFLVYFWKNRVATHFFKYFSRFLNIFPGFFRHIFSLKLNLIKNLSSIKHWIKLSYINFFFNETNFWLWKKTLPIWYIFFDQIKILLLNMLKMFNIPDFLFKILRFFQNFLNSKVQGFFHVFR